MLCKFTIKNGKIESSGLFEAATFHGYCSVPLVMSCRCNPVSFKISTYTLILFHFICPQNDDQFHRRIKQVEFYLLPIYCTLYHSGAISGGHQTRINFKMFRLNHLSSWFCYSSCRHSAHRPYKFSDMLVKLREQTIGETRGKNKDMLGD